eukprot:SAG31_NODE_72_length_27821_cov_26.870572_17_plen_50_part_00
MIYADDTGLPIDLQYAVSTGVLLAPDQARWTEKVGGGSVVGLAAHAPLY